MSAVSVSGLRKSYGAHIVLDAVDLDVPEGALTAVLGPSGCGKSTLLRIVAGFVTADAGTVRIGDRLVVDGSHRAVPARERGVGYVPQEGALFPHLSVAANIAYGLPRRDRRGRTGRERVAELLDLVELPTDLARRAPHQLSGGQQQRVALARALAPRPAVVVLDEPFSSLDAALRVTAGRAVRRALRQAGATGLLVTHDQGEAMSLADDVAVLRGGHVVQADPPSRLYAAPRDLETARFVGGGTALAGRVDGDPRTAVTALGELRLAGELPPGATTVLVRPEQVEIGDVGHAGTVEEVDFFGAHVVVQVRLPDDLVVTARGPAHAPPEPGQQVHVRVTGESVAFREGLGA